MWNIWNIGGSISAFTKLNIWYLLFFKGLRTRFIWRNPLSWRCFIFLRILEKEHLHNTLIWLVLLFFRLIFKKSPQILSSWFIKRNHVPTWNWIQKYRPKRLSSRKKRVVEFVVDETLLKISSELVWLWWVVIEEPANKEILAISASKERNKGPPTWIENY